MITNEQILELARINDLHEGEEGSLYQALLFSFAQAIEATLREEYKSTKVDECQQALNDGGFPVKNAPYWRREYNKLKQEYREIHYEWEMACERYRFSQQELAEKNKILVAMRLAFESSSTDEENKLRKELAAAQARIQELREFIDTNCQNRGLDYLEQTDNHAALDAAIAAEREACAKFIDAEGLPFLAKLLRARSKP